MDLNRLTRDADDLIRKVVSRYNQLYVPAGTISQLELDLMLDDLRKLYETFKYIGHINLTLHEAPAKPEVMVKTTVPPDREAIVSNAPANSEKQIVPDEPAQVKPHQESEPITEKKPEYISEPEYKTEPDRVVEDEIKEEIIEDPQINTEPAFDNQTQEVSEITQEVSEITIIEKPVQDDTESNKPINTEPTPAMLADMFNTGSKSLSETMASAQAQNGIGSRLLFQPISDLHTGIGLNDKFSFISDLFSNNTANYDEAITRINKAVNLDEANWILQKYHSTEWEQKHESLSRLKDFVKRRFI